MGQGEVFEIIRKNDNITKKDIEILYKEIFGELGIGSINASLVRLVKGKDVTRTMKSKIYYYKKRRRRLK